MSKNYFLLCITFSLFASLFFYKMSIDGGVKGFTLSDIILGKFLNQINTILILGYLLINYLKEKKLKINLFIIVLVVELSTEFLYFIFDQNSRWIYEILFIIVERVLMAYIFIKIDTTLIAKNNQNNVLSFLILATLIAFYFLKIPPQSNISLVLMLSFLTVLFFFCVLGINTENFVFHRLSLGVFLIMFSDLMFIYAEFNNTFYQYLYLIPRICSSFGMLIICYSILKNTLPLKSLKRKRL